MPLVDPITMSSSSSTPTKSSKAQSVSGKPTEPSQLQPVHLHATAASQAARHVFPVTIAGLFLAAFGHLVADPVPVMWTSLPVIAVLQVVYALVCLPMAGSGSGAGKNKKQRLGEKKKAGDGSGPNFFIVSYHPDPPPSRQNLYKKNN